MTAPKPKRAWLIYWIIGLGVLAFGVPEAIALADPDPGDTLTESIRSLTDGPVGVLVFLTFVAWFTWHILIQKRRTPKE